MGEIVFKEELYFQHDSKVVLQEKLLYVRSKRILDVFGSLCGLILLLPIFLVVAICIKYEDPRGSVFFKQQRIGKDGKVFNMYKFRSMVSGAEVLLDKLIGKNEISGAMFKMKNDPRVTEIGKLIRKTSIDELPQLWNVLLGDMSLVGPRPPLPREYDQYNDYHKQRLIVTPGCTGLWQISGRSALGFEEMVQLDLTYISMRTFLFDFKIIFKTFKVLFGSNDAY
jgi:lipopolysaccharide/colanic/teichoic acid biosynthesis glycosyltransferase